ncbi:hypothetical protein D9758_000315 [Tetrapyrgos nigripes]|uniref:Alpha-keto-beta-hydroxylacyl reductoisomerase n=1 Tax=Tetrapyrgos nigripes TaxID=182062 RepID=A0A8H5LZ06_9AGAR|nr:hypothetical protein D9758_000315 [Tetrapyrgos nigripes]
MPAKIYYDNDADLSLLNGKKIVFLGFGNQGSAQAQNLRDSGIPNDSILIANRRDSYAETAKSKGFHVEHDFGKAAEVADVLFLLVPDQVQPRVFNNEFAPKLKSSVTIVVASGYNVFYKLLKFAPTQGKNIAPHVVMVAPRMIGSSVRSLYEAKKGFPCFVSVEQEGSGNALSITLAIARAIGATKTGAIESSAREETVTDLFAEQALWPQIIMLFREAFSVLKEAGCSDEALCYEMWMSKEPAEIFERAADLGFTAQLKLHSSVSQYGQLSGALALDGADARAYFKDILNNRVLNGKFCEEFSKIEDDLEKEGLENPLNELYRRAEATEMGQAEKRSPQMSSLNGKMDVDKSPTHKSSRNHSTDTLRTRRSHRSVSRDRSDRDRKEKDRRKDRDDRRRRSRSRDRYDRERSRDRYRDRERRRDRDSDRHREDRRERGESRHSHRDYDRDKDKEDKDKDRRRKRPDEAMTLKAKSVARRRNWTMLMAPDPRDEFDDPPRYRRDYRDDRRPRRNSPPHRRRKDSPSPPPIKRASPTYEPPPDEPYNPDEPKEDDSEARSVFVTQLAARLTARDLGYFFEDKLGEGTVMDSRIVTDRLSRRSKGIGYVEFRTIELVEKALALSGTVVMGLPIMVQLTEAERNRLHPGDGNLNLPPGVSASHGGMQLYVGSLHFNLTESDIKQVFEPFGPLEFVDLHRDPMTGRSKGYAFVQYKRAEDAKMALEQMEGFELAGRTLRVNTVHEKGSVRYTPQDSLEESGGGNLNAASRQALMQKLARTESQPSLPEPIKPNIPQAMQSRSVLLKNMFDPEEETEKDWDKDLAMDVQGECEEKYGQVVAIKVERETQGEIYVKFDSIESAKKAIQGLNGRWFGGKQVSANFISDAIMQAYQ